MSASAVETSASPCRVNDFDALNKVNALDKVPATVSLVGPENNETLVASKTPKRDRESLEQPLEQSLEQPANKRQKGTEQEASGVESATNSSSDDDEYGSILDENETSTDPTDPTQRDLFDLELAALRQEEAEAKKKRATQREAAAAEKKERKNKIRNLLKAKKAAIPLTPEEILKRLARKEKAKLAAKLAVQKRAYQKRLNTGLREGGKVIQDNEGEGIQGSPTSEYSLNSFLNDLACTTLVETDDEIIATLTLENKELLTVLLAAFDQLGKVQYDHVTTLLLSRTRKKKTEPETLLKDAINAMVKQAISTREAIEGDRQYKAAQKLASDSEPFKSFLGKFPTAGYSRATEAERIKMLKYSSLLTAENDEFLEKIVKENLEKLLEAHAIASGKNKKAVPAAAEPAADHAAEPAAEHAALTE
jgi:hypothetical protein